MTFKDNMQLTPSNPWTGFISSNRCLGLLISRKMPGAFPQDINEGSKRREHEQGTRQRPCPTPPPPGQEPQQGVRTTAECEAGEAGVLTCFWVPEFSWQCWGAGSTIQPASSSLRC